MGQELVLCFLFGIFIGELKNTSDCAEVSGFYGAVSLYAAHITNVFAVFWTLGADGSYACVCADELLQQQGSDSALHSVWGVWTAVGGGCRGDGLLAADGGGNRTAAEPNCGCKDGVAFWPLESVLHSRYMQTH